MSYGARVSTEAGEESPNVFFSKSAREIGSSVHYQKDLLKLTKKLSPNRAPADFYSAFGRRDKAEASPYLDKSFETSEFQMIDEDDLRLCTH